jgi:OOP family OmpA-OmpF porin
MKFYPIALSAAFLFAVSSAQANGLYGGISLVGTSTQDAVNNEPGLITETEFDRGLGFSGHVGTTLKHIRVEGEVAWQKSDADNIVVLDDGGGGTVGDIAKADGDVSSLALMANAFYDFDTGGPWKPYLGIGLGYARISLDLSALGQKLSDDSDNVIAYQAMAGVGYAVSPTITIYGGYKYFDTQDTTQIDVDGTSFDTELKNHNIEVGVRFAF